MNQSELISKIAEVSGLTVGDARYLVAAIAELVPECLGGIRVDHLERLQRFADAGARLMAAAEEDVYALASDLQDIQFSITQGA